MSKILAGVRVIDHGTMITGPFATMLLADLGAEVIKVERSGGGDPYRSFQGGLYAPHFQANNRNKQSVVLDLEQESGRQMMLRLVDKADVYVQNFRPGVAEKLGLDANALRARNPKLVYCAITGFGSTGPYCKRPAYDTVAQALSGFLSMFVSKTSLRVVGPAIADSITGLYACYGILAALVAQRNSGVGRTVEVSMIEAMMHFASEPYANYFASGKPWEPFDRARISQSYVFLCSDGLPITFHLSSQAKFWEGLLRAVERPELAADPRFAARMDRVSHQEQLIEELRPVFLTRTRADWVQRLTAEDVPHAPMFTLGEALHDQQVKHLGMEINLQHPVLGPSRAIRPAVVFDGVQDATGINAAPTLDQHGEVLRAALTPDLHSSGEHPVRTATETSKS